MQNKRANLLRIAVHFIFEEIRSLRILKYTVVRVGVLREAEVVAFIR